MNDKHIYTAHPEYISRDVELADGSNTNELYALEAKIYAAIREIVNWRVKHLCEKEWTAALPQTLRTLLEGYDKSASEVAARSFLSKKVEIIKE